MRRTRKTKPRPLKKLIVVVCEGDDTEPSYFGHVFDDKAANHHKYSFRISQPKDNSPLGVVREARREKQAAIRDKIARDDISIWAVFDKDSHHGVADAFAMAKAHDIKVIFSSICFEFWILLHYCQTSKPFSTCDELISHIRQHYDKEYGKKIERFEKLKDRIGTALENGHWLEKQVQNDIDRGTKIYELNPYTNAHRLVEYLLNL